MNVSPSILLGLGVALLSEEVFRWLPGEASTGRLALAALVTPLPLLWARATGRATLAVAAREGATSRALRLAQRVQPLTVPIGFLVWTGYGGLLELVERVAPGSHLLQFALLLAPLLAMEIGLRATERRTLLDLERMNFAGTSGLGPSYSGMTALLVIAVLGFGAALDLLELDRRLEVFFQATSIGTTTGAIAMVLGLSAMLPLLFRLVLPTSHTLPDAVAAEVLDAAQRLGFSPRSVLSLRTELRVVNAALIGPLRWPRYLILTDGILAYLDRVALRGVVAHEVGHARAGHPALLLVVFAVVPLLLFHPLSRLDLTDVDPLLLVGIGAVAALAGFFGMRKLMHRFEYEADQLSAMALGGALPCIMALRRVGDLFPSQRGRTSFRHPSEEQRVRSLASWDADPSYRESFLRRGRAVRHGIFAVLVVALGVSAWSHLRSAAFDVAVVRFYTGEFARAADALDSMSTDIDPERTARLRAELVAASSLVPGGGPWNEIEPELAARAWSRAIDVASANGMAAARPFFALALGPVDDPLRRSAWLWSEAVADGDTAQVARLAAHVATFADLPAPLRALTEH